MRKIFLLVSALSMGMAAPTVTAPAQATAPDLGAIQDLCAELTSEHPNLSLGECVSIFVSTDMTDDAFAAQYCRILRDAGYIEDSEYSSCVLSLTNALHGQ